jgi:hypothetical protein
MRVRSVREELVIHTHGFDNFLGQGADPGIFIGTCLKHDKRPVPLYLTSDDCPFTTEIIVVISLTTAEPLAKLSISHLMTLADKDFPSSQTFDLIDQVLQDPETRAEMMKSANAIFGFDLTSPDGSKQVIT